MGAMFFLVIWFQIWMLVMGYRAGAPNSTCTSMMPGHGVAAQSNPSPYEIQTSSNGTFWPNTSITVTIKGSDYAGLQLQARTGSDSNALGTWGTAPPNTKHLECSGNSQGAITHSNNVMKNNQTVYTWTPSGSFKSVFFTATVVHNRTVFWVNVRSANLNRGETAGSAADPKTAFTPGLLLLTLLMSTMF